MFSTTRSANRVFKVATGLVAIAHAVHITAIALRLQETPRYHSALAWDTSSGRLVTMTLGPLSLRTSQYRPLCAQPSHTPVYSSGKQGNACRDVGDQVRYA